MNDAPRTSSPYPVTLHDWERTLTKALLRADTGNADAIHSFEITPETLAAFCGLGNEHAAEAEQAFRSALVNDTHLTWCLQNGRYLTSGTEVPNCMAMLAFSLLIESLLDGDYEETGQYRAKVRHWLRIDRTFANLRGIALMWEELVAWLAAKVAEGAPFRRLILPQIPPKWTHIGYTRYLSFPTRRDLHFLRKQIERDPKLVNDPGVFIRRLDPIIRSSPISFGLRGAFDDFRTALRSGGASVDHRFWRLVGRAKKMAGVTEAPLVDLRMEFDEDGVRHYRVKEVGSSNVSLPPDVGSAAASPTVLESPNLGPSVRRGVLFFRSSGLAHWTAVGEPPSGIGPFHLAVSDRHARITAGTMASFEKSGWWHVTKEPVPPGTVSDILVRLGIHDVRESVRAVGLVDGVHVGKAWLGLPRFLPRIDGPVGAIDIRPTTSDATPALSCTAGELMAIRPVEGEFAFSNPVTGWSRRATFVPMAEVHAELDGANYLHPEMEELRLGQARAMPRAATLDLVWDDGAYAYQDVLEALYACSRSGVGEGDAVALCGRAVGRRSWELLRTLQESTFLEARLRLRWRGRVFTLVRPTLNEVHIGAVHAVAVCGAVPMRLEMDFHRTVELQGGRAFRHLVEGSMAPALLGAVDVDPARLSCALGWAVVGAIPYPEGAVTDRLCETKIIGETFRAASAWDWSKGRFRIGAHGDGSVSLIRLVHPGERDHDLYRVAGDQHRTFISRFAAIIEAYAQAGRPLFKYDAGRIHRLTAEGGLPLEIARALRLRTLQNGGASDEGWEYTLTPRDDQWLSGLLPGLVASLPASASSPELTYLRGRGARRPIWINGDIAV